MWGIAGVWQSILDLIWHVTLEGLSPSGRARGIWANGSVAIVAGSSFFFPPTAFAAFAKPKPSPTWTRVSTNLTPADSSPLRCEVFVDCHEQAQHVACQVHMQFRPQFQSTSVGSCGVTMSLAHSFHIGTSSSSLSTIWYQRFGETIYSYTLPLAHNLGLAPSTLTGSVERASTQSATSLINTSLSGLGSSWTSHVSAIYHHIGQRTYVDDSIQDKS